MRLTNSIVSMAYRLTSKITGQVTGLIDGHSTRVVECCDHLYFIGKYKKRRVYMKSSGIGGQAVLEGVMMKNKNKYAVAVRKPDGTIAVEKGECSSIAEKSVFFRLPIIRGVVAFVESLMLGMKTLTSSADYYEDEEVVKRRSSMTKEQKEKAKKKENVETVLTVIVSIVLAVAIFMVLPVFLSELLKGKIKSTTTLAVIEGLIRIVMFIGYILLISLMEDIHRVFMYHGAEHKVINCIEHGYELNVKNARKQSKQHKRCGTSFLFIVMFISIVFFVFLNFSNIWLRFASRILLVPVIAGVSYEFIRLAGNSDNIIVNILSKPGLLLQGLTTREPDDSMLEVAIASVEAVFDWEEYLRKNRTKRRKSAGNESAVLESSSNRKNKYEAEESVDRPKKKKAKKSRNEIREEMRQRELDNKKRAEERAKLLKEQLETEAELERIADEAVRRKKAKSMVNVQIPDEDDGLDSLDHFFDENNIKDEETALRDKVD